MIPFFPNCSFNDGRTAVRFLTRDGMFEVSFFVSTPGRH